MDDSKVLDGCHSIDNVPKKVKDKTQNKIQKPKTKTINKSSLNGITGKKLTLQASRSVKLAEAPGTS